MKKIIITGNVGKDPETRASSAGEEYTTFSVAVSVGTKDNPKTDWVDVTCSKKLSDIARLYVRKGTKVLVEGFPSVSAYISKDNKPMSTLRVSAHNLELLSKKDETTSRATYSLPEISQEPLDNGNLNGDVPF